MHPEDAATMLAISRALVDELERLEDLYARSAFLAGRPLRFSAAVKDGHGVWLELRVIPDEEAAQLLAAEVEYGQPTWGDLPGAGNEDLPDA